MIESANLTRRISASLLDYGIYFLFFWVYLSYFGEPTSDGYQVSGFMTIPLILGWFIYFPFSEILFGKTVAKYFLNLEVIKLNGEKLNFPSAIKRRIVDPLELFFFGVIAIITFKNTELNQRVGDLWAKTQVV